MNSSIIDPETLEMFSRVLDESLAQIVETPSLDALMPEDLRTHVAQHIVAAFERGEVDPVKLKQIAVGTFAPAPEDVG